MIARYLFKRAIRRAGASLWHACEEHAWVPASIAIGAWLALNLLN